MPNSVRPYTPQQEETRQEGSAEVEEKKRNVGPIELFRYATPLDWLMLCVGALSGLAHGTTFVLFLVVLGESIDEFSDYTSCRQNFTICSTSDVDRATDMLINEINYPIVVQYCVLGILAQIFAWLQITLFQIAGVRQINRIRILYFQSVLKQEIGWFDQNSAGELNSRLSNDLEKVASGIGEKFSFVFQAVGVALSGIVVGFVYVWQLTLVVLGCAPLVIAVGAILQWLTTKITRDEQMQYARAGAVAEEVLGSVRTVTAFGGQENEVVRYVQCLSGAQRSGIKKGIFSGIGYGVTFVVLFTIIGITFWFCGYLITNSSVSPGDLITTLFSVIVGAQFLGQAFPNLQEFAVARGSAGALYDVIDRKPEIASVGIMPSLFNGDVSLFDVSFSYPSRPNVQVLHKLTISVKAGQTLALVGSSGCGKSTVIQLIQRFYDVSNGQVLVGGYNVRDLSLCWLRQHIGVVSQEPVLFATTIAENIQYGRSNATQAEIEEAAKAANAHSFITELPNGYDTLVGERGTQLSGGQKQRVAIARAIIRDPKILLLDEATSALDSESEALVQAALDKVREGRTTIVIAHRLSTIQGADVIAAIDNGILAEVGTHIELLDKKGVYFDLVMAQSSSSQKAKDDDLVTDMIKKYKKDEGEGTLDHMMLNEVEISRQNSHVKGREDSNEDETEEVTNNYSTAVVLWRILQLNFPELHHIILALIFSAIGGMAFPCYSLFFGEILDDFVDQESAEENSRFWGGLFVVIGAVAGFATFLRSVFFSLSGEALTSRLRELSFRHILRQDMSWFDQPKHAIGKLTAKLSHDTAQVQGAVGIRLGSVTEVVVVLLASLIIALVYSWSITLVVIGMVPILIITNAAQTRVLAGATASSKRGYEESTNVAYEAIGNIRTVASLTLEDKLVELFIEKLKSPHRSSLYTSVFFGFMTGLSTSLLYYIYATVYRYGAYSITLDSDHLAYTSFKDFNTVVTALVVAGYQTGQISIFLPNYSKAIISAKKILQLLDIIPIIDSYSEEGLQPDTATGDLSIDKLSFTYASRSAVPVLQGISIGVKAGRTLALVGPSGCGKSTVVSLIERFYDPNSGILRFDGYDLRELNIQWLRRQMGLVSQEPVLFDVTIADNIRYGALFREVTDKEVELVAKSANIHDFIMSLPNGYNTRVGERGTQLSGGQKQRVAIARALIRDPKILLLDEATSALDSESEKIVQEALDSASEGRTSVVIAHRLSTIHNANCIAVIKDGDVIEVGNHMQLMEQRGIYYRLNKAQRLI